MKIVFLLFAIVFACCDIIYRIDAAKAEEDTSSVTQQTIVEVSVDEVDAKQQEIESKETDESKLADDDTRKQESSTESARGDDNGTTNNVADTDRKAEPTTPVASPEASPEKPRDDETGFGEEGTVVEANPNPPPSQAPQPVDPFYRPTVIYNVPSSWPPVVNYPGYPSYPSYPSYPGYELGYPGVGYNPWLMQQRVQPCPPGFTLTYSRIGGEMCRRANIFHNFYAAPAHHLQ